MGEIYKPVDPTRDWTLDDVAEYKRRVWAWHETKYGPRWASPNNKTTWAKWMDRWKCVRRIIARTVNG